MTQWNDKCILHMDLDAFFASVEQLDHPEYRGRPVIVGGMPGDRRSVVSTASYEARKFGVHSAMPTAKAFQLCPQGIYIHPRMERYHILSQQVMSIFQNYSPDVQQISVDEAFIDLSGTEKLFGNPSDTARRIKKEVKDRTGLTISVGLASNKYVAKIASGLSKPDGFYEVFPGGEEQFMLSLPLEKVWGIGTKTQERLRNAGLKTPKDIHDRSAALLESLFGTAAGRFLFNAVRGNEVETFDEAKTHSLSSETTFSFDLTDRYTIGTELMELADTVIFRMLKEKVHSRTVALKIRYEDFTTVSVQETSADEVTSLENLYERASVLFDKKYETGRGIRLLGLGVQNTDSGPLQQNLFDFGESKKSKVEKAILSLEEKDPSIKIKKARLLDKKRFSVLLPVLAASLLYVHVSAYAGSMNQTNASGAGSIVFDESVLPPEQDSPSALFQYTIHDKNIEFLADGYWESTLSSTAEASFGFGSPFALSLGTPVLSQKVDMSLWFMVDKTWYFEAAFADGFEKNTVAAGYYGKGILKEARIANRGIVFPSTYSIDKVNRGIGGGDNQAPGILLHFADDTEEKWHGDFAFRYDMLESHDKTYYGMNSVSDNDISPSVWLSGQLYVLPDKDITAAVTAVYVESSSGTYTDLQGRKYKKLSESEYLILPARCQVILSSDAGAAKKNGIVPAVAFEFSSSSDIAAVSSALGTYGTTAASGSGFLGAIQTFFGSKADDTVNKPNVASYSYGGTNSAENVYAAGTHSKPDASGTRIDGFFTYIGGTSGTEVLLVQHPAGFSPFAGAWRYDGGTGEADSVVIASSSSDTESSVYTAQVSDDVTFVSNDFFSDSHTYVDVYSSSSTSSAANAAVSPSIRYPMADSFPGYYLGYAEQKDIVVRLRTYTAVSRLDIGTDAVPGTICVYKNGVIDSGAKYDSESGTVTLSTSVTSSDRIYITWYQDSSSADSGALTAAAGLAYSFTPELSSDLSLSTRWAYNTSTKFADSSSSAPGFVTLAGGVKYKTENAELTNTSAVTFEQNNVTGYYRVLGMNDAVPSTVYLTESAGVSLPDDVVPELNSRPDDSSSQPVLSDTYNGSVSAADGTTDSSISGYKIPVSWDFSSWKGNTLTGSSRPWAATTINLKSAASELSSGTKFTIALKPADTAVTDYDVYLQLGVDASSDFTVEDTGSVPTWHIYDSSSAADCRDVQTSFSPSTSGWQKTAVILKDEDRTRFTSVYSARLIIVMKDNTEITSSNEKGTIYAGPYEITTQGVFTSQNDAFTVTTEQTADTLSNSTVKRFNSSTNHVQKVAWKNTGTVTSQSDDDFDIVISRYFAETDITPYTQIGMYFRYTYADTSSSTPAGINDSTLTFILDREATGITEKGKEAVCLKINQNAFSKCISSSAVWHSLTVDRTDNTVSIDGTELASAYYSLHIDTDYVPTRLKMTVSTACNGAAYTSGEFCFDELYLSGSTPHYILENAASGSWKKTGTVISAGDFPIVQDISLTGTGTAAATLQTSATQDNGHSLSGSTGAGITLATIALKGDISHSADCSSILSNAGHSAATTVPVLGIISAAEEYRFDRTGKALNKSNSAGLDFHAVGIPVTVKGNTSASSDPRAVTQKSDVSVSVPIGSNMSGYVLGLKSSVTQKLLPSSEDADRLPTDSYQQGWKDSTAMAFSTGRSNASRRSISGEIDNTFHLPFAGLTPEIDFSADGLYKSSTSVLFTDSASFKTAIPFSVGNSRITVSWTKESGSVQQDAKGGDYARDFYEVSDSLSDRTWFFKSVPFYDLFSTSLAHTVLADTSMTSYSAESLYYTTTYSTSWKRPVYGTTKDIWIPTNITLSAARDIRTSATISDIYQIKAVAGYTAFNIFGSESRLNWFSWYKQDEYTGSLSAAAKIPRTDPDSVSMLYTGYLQANMYINDTDTLKTGGELDYEKYHEWSTKYTLVWKRRGHMSPLIGIIFLFKPEYDDSHIILTRTDSFNCSFSETESSSTTNSKIIRKQSFSFTHLLDMQMTKYLTVTGSLGETYACTWGTSILLTASASIGAKIKF